MTTASVKRHNKSARRGFGLLEAMIAVFILSVMSLSLASMYKYMTLVAVKTRQNSYATRLSEMVFAKLKTMEYYYIFDCDSALPNFGLTGTFGPVTAQKSAYPYLGLLRDIDAAVKRYKVDRWTLSVAYKVRDVSDVNGNGLTSDLRDFTDANGDKADDYDSSLKYYKANPSSDSDYYDTYTSASLNKTVTETPDTNLKEVTFRLYRNGTVIHTQKELVSLEMLSGIESKASGAELKLLLTQPENNAYLYDLASTARADAYALTISKAYPSDITTYRADSSSPLNVIGETSPLATIKFYRNSIGTVRDTQTSGALGTFSFWASGLTNALTEGVNVIYAQATKSTYYSPYAERTVILDLKPPELDDETPTGAAHDLMPYVGAVLTDTVQSTGVPSGICEQVTSMRVNGSEVPFTYSRDTGEIQWVDGATGLPAKLTDGSSYSVVVEGGDRAGYKTSSSWSFTASIPYTDNSAPAISNKTPIGSASDPMPEISCKIMDNQSGINLDTIVMTVDGVTVVDSSNIASHWNAREQRLVYRPAAAFDNYTTHSVEVTATHWANDPAGTKTVTEKDWSFTVNY